MFADADTSGVIRRLRYSGVGEIALKMGARGWLMVDDHEQELVAANKVSVVDTTSAGDSFNAGYLAARLKGCPASEAANRGHRLAAVVIQHTGAIIPLSAMPD
ncbi:PfkB family carbohydrate kinase [Seongchinamella unica]|uniref:PfkB family carbohydrate kinase n=1 Tax=Seongchinamella unica TaxID=2547392 RepID=UPI001EED70F9|nr:PfkB family carbohydrate kinase [Seongchinamella unica]